MKKFAKLLAMVLAVSMVLTMFVGAYNDADKIVDEDKAAAIEAVYNAGVMMGDDKGNFNPTAGLRRSEMAKILFALSSYEQKAAEGNSIIAALTFEDYADIQNWAKAYVGYAAAAGYIVGTTDGNANANGTLCYADAAIMLLRTLGLDKDDQGEYLTYTVGEEDEYKIFEGPKAYANAITVAYNEGLFNLNEDGDTIDFINYREAISREDVAVMIANAIDHADADYALAEKVTGVITGVTTEEEDDEKITIAIINDMAELEVDYTVEEVEAVLGYEVSLIVEGEDEEVLNMTVVEPAYNEVVTLGDIEIKDIDEDDDKVIYSILVGEDVILENANVVSKYIANNSNEYTKVVGTIRDLLAAEKVNNGFQDVQLIINEGSLCIKYAPVGFEQFNNSLLVPFYDTDKKEYTGEYTYAGMEFPYGDIEIEDGTWCYAQVIDETVVGLGFLSAVKAEEFEVAFDATADAGEEYSVTYKGNELIIYKGCAAKSAIWQNVLKGEDYTAYIYNDEVLVAYGPTPSEDDDEDPTVYYAIVNGYTATVEVGEDEDENPIYTWTVTVNAIVDNAEKEITFVQEQTETDGLAFINTFGLEAGYVFEVTETVVDDEAEISMSKYASVSYGLYIDYQTDIDAAVEAEKAAFINLTEGEVEFDDITVETDARGNTVVKVGEQKVSGASLMAFWVESEGNIDYAVVVYDPGFEFGVWGEFLPDEE